MKYNKIQTIQYNSDKYQIPTCFGTGEWNSGTETCRIWMLVMNCILWFVFYFIDCICWLIKCNLNAYLICSTCNTSKYENSDYINIKWLSEHSNRHRHLWLCLYLPGLQPTHLTSVSTFLWGYFLKRTHFYLLLYTLTFVSDGLWFISNLPILLYTFLHLICFCFNDAVSFLIGSTTVLVYSF
jgi:hypothetical protein